MKGGFQGPEIACLEPAVRERFIDTLAIEKLNVPFLAAERHLIIIELEKWRA